MGLGTPEIIVIVAIALILFGPKKLPQLGKAIGKSLREFKDAAAGINRELEEAAEAEEAEKRVARQSSKATSAPDSQPAPPESHEDGVRQEEAGKDAGVAAPSGDRDAAAESGESGSHPA